MEDNRARQVLFQQLMNVPHRQLTPMVHAFMGALDDDPDFIGRACVHLATGGTKIRDQADAAIVTLLFRSDFPQFREAGLCALGGRGLYPTIQPEDLDIPGLPPYRLLRVVRYLDSPWINTSTNGDVLSRHFSATDAQGAMEADAKRAGVDVDSVRAHVDMQHVRASRAIRSFLCDWIEQLARDQNRLDGVVLNNRREFTRVVTAHHIKVPSIVQAFLFGDAPAGSKVAVLKQIAKSDDLAEQVRLTIENHIPYRIAAAVLPKKSPAVAMALIEVMSPTEALNSRAWVERSGLLEFPEVKDVYLRKVANAQRSVASAEHRRSAQGTNAEVQAAIDNAKERAVQADAKIERDTVLLVDRSSSMREAIEIACQFGSRIAPLVTGQLGVAAFHEYGQLINIQGDRGSYQAWKHAFSTIRPIGRTSMEAGLGAALNGGFMPEQVVIVTDEGENVGDYVQALQNYIPRSEYDNVHTVVINVGASHESRFTEQIRRVGLRVDRFVYSGDYYVLDQVVSLLGGPPAKTFVETILETPLPYRLERICA